MTLEPGDHVWYWNGNISQELSIPQSSWFPGFQGPTDYLGHGKEIFNFVIYENEVARGRPHMRNHPGSHAWLNNNPGNITGVPGGPDFGQFPNKFNWHHFLIFPSWEAGFDAIAQLLRSPKYASHSITDAFRIYAPASDGNDPVRYAQDVAAATGVPESTTIQELDDDQMLVMQNKIMQIEGVIPGETLAYDSPELPEEITALLP
ncbi:hypothetical protein [Streptomyces sp. HUAS ZL42]|uniref:hypothetical protein n=1 Tax=Streptomyces sp. HUAS ZL42 TaxID=3231715 RepID=UPI00345E79E1